MTRIIIVEENAVKNSNKHNSVSNEKSSSSLEDELRMIKDGFGNLASITVSFILMVYLNNCRERPIASIRRWPISLYITLWIILSLDERLTK